MRSKHETRKQGEEKQRRDEGTTGREEIRRIRKRRDEEKR